MWRPRLRRAGHASRSRSAPEGKNPDVRIWQEDESPYERVAQGLSDRGISSGTIGFEETVKFVFTRQHQESGSRRGIYECDSGHCGMPDDQERA